MKHAIAFSLAALAVAGCIPKADADTVSDSSSGACNADPVQSYIGQTLTDDLAAKMQRKAGASVLRVAHKDGMITMDYNAGRLNIFHDDAKVIARVNCG